MIQTIENARPRVALAEGTPFQMPPLPEIIAAHGAWYVLLQALRILAAQMLARVLRRSPRRLPRRWYAEGLDAHLRQDIGLPPEAAKPAAWTALQAHPPC